jgi:hypothetical protein
MPCSTAYQPLCRTLSIVMIGASAVDLSIDGKTCSFVSGRRSTSSQCLVLSFTWLLAARTRITQPPPLIPEEIRSLL